MKKIFRLIDKSAASNAPVVIQGESGTGKELIARAIHVRGGRCARPFVVVNCAGIPENLLESELFGHEAGSFTGAIERKHGKFEEAHGGSIFLDEIGSMPMALQAKILRVLQENKDGYKEIERVGSSKLIAVDVRVISATNNDLKAAIKQGKFREDLFYRLNVIPIDVPPLRQRQEDITLLAEYYVDKYSRSMNKGIRGIDRSAMDVFLSYSWPGNVRELKNIIERIITLKLEGDISIDDLPLEMSVASSHTEEQKASDPPFIAAKGQLDRQFIMRALKKTGGNQIKAAKHLGMHRNTLRMKMSQLGIKKTISDSSEKNHLNS
jgi:transcriptional regulator with PAS, ATPase and Fis domain